MMKQITENLNVSPDENDIIDELTSIIGGWGETSEKQDILGLIKNYTNNKSLYEDVRVRGPINWDKYREAGFAGSSGNYRDDVVLTDKVFYSIIELLVNEKDIEEWEGFNSNIEDNLQARLNSINPISKLFGVNLIDEHGDTDGIVSKLFWAVIDNYHDIKSGEIDEFKYLSLRKLKSYRLDLSENMQERRTYTWTVEVDGYDKDEVIGIVISNSDGGYDPWEHNFEVDNEEITYRDGIEIDNIREVELNETTHPQNIIEEINRINELIN